MMFNQLLIIESKGVINRRSPLHCLPIISLRYRSMTGSLLARAKRESLWVRQTILYYMLLIDLYTRLEINSARSTAKPIRGADS